jgi:hypothetical protein
MSWQEVSDGKEGEMKKIIVFIVLWLLVCFGMLCAADVVLDLSKDPGRIEPIKVSMDIDRIVMTNYIPAIREKYKVKIEVQEYVPEPLPIPSGFIDEKGPCSDLVTAIKDFVDFNQADFNVEWEKGEMVIAGKYEKIRIELGKTKCGTDTIKNRAKEILTMQDDTIGGPFVMKEGDEVMVTITRGKYIWTYSISRPHGNWFVSYGFSFISPLIYRPDKYFVTNNPDDEKSFLLKQSPREAEWYDLEFVPSVFFWWMPAKARKWNIGPTAGLGFDMKDPVVFAGVALVYNYNIGVNAGLAFHQLNILKDQYVPETSSEDAAAEDLTNATVIKENLSPDQLYDRKYRFNLFISITFRFGSNPFKSGEK